MPSADRPATRFATRVSFLVAGFGVACWAPLVPFAQQRLAIDDAVLGTLLLCLGAGSVTAMILTGILSTRYGSKPIIISAGAALAVALPLLSIANTPPLLGLALLAFGASLGSLDVAMNMHAVEVERAASRPLMSGFHAFYSIGGFAGSAVMTSLLSMKLGPVASTLGCSVLMIISMKFVGPRLLTAARTDQGALFAVPRGIILLFAALTAITFLAEGAMLDWSALLITGDNLVSNTQGGMGYMFFSIAMTVGRLGGDALTARLGDRAVLFWGGLVAVIGFAVLLTATIAATAMGGFVLIGIGASNIVPVLFRRAGANKTMPVGLAVASVTMAGYSGNILGPAAIGFVAKASSLPIAFWMVAALLGLVTLCARIVTADQE
jgi:predicted MFS family arabinose efflux permease